MVLWLLLSLTIASMVLFAKMAWSWLRAFLSPLLAPAHPHPLACHWIERQSTVSSGPKDLVNTRILQTLMSGIPGFVDLRTKIGDPYVYGVLWVGALSMWKFGPADRLQSNVTDGRTWTAQATARRPSSQRWSCRPQAAGTVWASDLAWHTEHGSFSEGS